MITILSFPISPTTVAETNLLLRSLWAKLRKEFGRLSWHFSPEQDAAEQTIYFGWADIGVGDSVRIGIKYKRRGVATQVLFMGATAQEHRLKKCLRAARIAVGTPGTYSSSADFRMSIDAAMSSVVGDHVALSSPISGVLRVALSSIEAFDEYDGRTEFKRRLNLVIDSLAFLTNMSFTLVASESSGGAGGALEVALMQVETGEEASKGVAVEDLANDPVDGFAEDQGVQSEVGEGGPGESAPGTSAAEDPASHPGANGCLEQIPDNAIDPKQQGLRWLEGHSTEIDAIGLRLLDLVSGVQLDPKFKMLTDAAHHFHNGLLFDKPWSYPSNVELIVVLYISSLETASLIGVSPPKRCSECGQPRYSISERVRNFVHTKLGEHAAEFIKRLYGSRSDYLHQGILLSTRSYTGLTIPQLDPSSETGILLPLPLVEVPHLREYTSYCLRELAAEWLAAKT